MNAGDTFFVQQVGKLYDSHLWMVLSNPALNANQVLIVSLTTWGKDDDPACVLNVGDHPFVRQKSFIKYSHAKIVSDQQLEEFRARGQIHVQAQLSLSVLKRARDGAAESRFMALGHADILIDQGLIDC